MDECSSTITKSKKVLILDLDETLAFRTKEPVPTTTFTIFVPAYGTVVKRYISVRPGVSAFLETMAPHFDVHLFTAGFPHYANRVLDHLDTSGVIQTRLYNDSCIDKGDNWFMKDPTRISADLSATIIVDDDSDTFLYPDNGITVSAFNTETADAEDQELSILADFLLGIKDTADVRTECPKWSDWREKELQPNQEDATTPVP